MVYRIHCTLIVNNRSVSEKEMKAEAFCWVWRFIVNNSSGSEKEMSETKALCWAWSQTFDWRSMKARNQKRRKAFHHRDDFRSAARPSSRSELQVFGVVDDVKSGGLLVLRKPGHAQHPALNWYYARLWCPRVLAVKVVSFTWYGRPARFSPSVELVFNGP